ncbi:MAG: hypothetical protein AB8B65_05465 [Kordia sp.]|uniref:hypothetical protein n=1 Tax=Kordia sp. TaxID=1965332 RepID=UPI00385F80A6
MLSLNFFRNKYFTIALSSLFFVFSCTTHGVETADTNARSIDYSTFQSFKSNTKNLNDLISTHQLNKNSESISEISQAILDEVNSELATNIAYPNTVLELPDYLGEEIIEISLANGWIEDVDVNLINSFISDLESNDFNHAMSNFENSILTLEVSDEKFEKLNLTANLIQSAYYDTPEVFDNLQKSEDGWVDCAIATLALASATAGLASCATVVACAAAVALHYGAMTNFGRACFPKKPNAPELTDH